MTGFESMGDAADYDHVLDVFGKTTNPQERLRHLWALADFDSAELMDRTCELTLTDTIRSQNAPFLLARCMRNRDHGEQAWRFVARNWTTLNERFPSTSIIRMVDGVRLLMRPEQASEVRAFFSERGVPQAAKTLEQVLERQQINAAFRTRESDQLAASLH